MHSNFFRLAFLLLLLALQNICMGQKTGDNGMPSSVSTEKRFFQLSDSLPPEVRAVANAVVRQNKQFRFIDTVVKYAGYPQWDKAIIARKPPVGGSPETYVYIPYVKDGAKALRAVLAVAMQKDTFYRMAYTEYWCTFPFDTTNVYAWNARQIFSLFAFLEYRIFGHRDFLVSDGRFFGGSRTETAYLHFLPGKEPLDYRNLPFPACFQYELRRSKIKDAGGLVTEDVRRMTICPPLTLRGEANPPNLQQTGSGL